MSEKMAMVIGRKGAKEIRVDSKAGNPPDCRWAFLFSSSVDLCLSAVMAELSSTFDNEGKIMLHEVVKGLCDPTYGIHNSMSSIFYTVLYLFFILIYTYTIIYFFF